MHQMKYRIYYTKITMLDLAYSQDDCKNSTVLENDNNRLMRLIPLTNAVELKLY